MHEHIRPDQIGVWVKLTPRDGGPQSEGWLVGSTSQGILVTAGNNVDALHLVRDYASISYDHNRRHPGIPRKDELRTIQYKIDKTSEELEAEYEKAFNQLNYNRIRSINLALVRVRNDLDRLDRFRWFEPDAISGDLKLGYILARVDDVVALHRNLFQEFQISGVIQVTEKTQEKLADVPVRYLIPEEDVRLIPIEKLDEYLRLTEEGWSQSRHERALQKAERLRFEMLEPRIPELPEEKVDDGSTFFSRWLGPSLRVIGGTALATGNAALGITAGLTTTITTIGATAVPVYLGVAGSIWTGLSGAADGLEKIGRRK